MATAATVAIAQPDRLAWRPITSDLLRHVTKLRPEGDTGGELPHPDGV
jgi:hypothetical protein